MLKAGDGDARAGRQHAMAIEVQGFAAAASRFCRGQDAVKLAIFLKGKAGRGQRRLKGGNKIGLLDRAARSQRDVLLDAGIDDKILSKDGSEHRLRDLAHIGFGKIKLDLIVAGHRRADGSAGLLDKFAAAKLRLGAGVGRAFFGRRDEEGVTISVPLRRCAGSLDFGRIAIGDRDQGVVGGAGQASRTA